MKYNEDQLIIRLNKPFYIKNIDKNAPTETDINYEVIKQVTSLPNIDVEVQLLNNKNEIIKIFKNYDATEFDIEDFKQYINDGDYFIRIAANTISSNYQLSRSHYSNITHKTNRQPIISDIKNSKTMAKLFGKDYYYLIISSFNVDNDNLYYDIYTKDLSNEFTNQILEDYPNDLIQLARYLDMNNIEPDSLLPLKIVLKDYRDYNNTDSKIINIDTSFLSDIGNYYNEWLTNKYYTDFGINRNSYFANVFKYGMVFSNDTNIINSFYYYNVDGYEYPFYYFIIYDKINNEIIKDDYYKDNITPYYKQNNIFIFNDYIINNSSFLTNYYNNKNDVIRNGLITLINNNIYEIIRHPNMSKSTNKGYINKIYDELNYLFISFDQNPYYFNFKDKNLYSINKNNNNSIFDNNNFYLHPLFVLSEQYKYMDNYNNNYFFYLGVELNNKKQIIFHNDNKIYKFNTDKNDNSLFENYYIDFFGSGLKDFFHFGAIGTKVYYYVKMHDDRKYIIKYDFNTNNIDNYIQLIDEHIWIYGKSINSYICGLTYKSSDNKNYLMIMDENLNVKYLNDLHYNSVVLNPTKDDLDYNINRIRKIDDNNIYMPDFDWCINLEYMTGFKYTDYISYFLDKDYYRDGSFYFWFDLIDNKPVVRKYNVYNNIEIGALQWTTEDLDTIMYMDNTADELIYFKSPEQKIFVYFEFRGFDKSSYLQIFKDEYGNCNHIIYNLKTEIFDKLSKIKGLFLDKHRLRLQFNDPYLYMIFYPLDDIKHEDITNINEYLDKKFIIIRFDIYTKEMHQQII